MKNDYEVRGDVTAIFLPRKDGTILEALIDTEDLARVSDFFATLNCDHGYVNGHPTSDYRRKVYLHIFIVGTGSAHVDHVHHNKLDNRKSELHAGTCSQNLLNRVGASGLSRSGHRGVHWHSQAQRWAVRFKVAGKGFSFGMYEIETQAVEEANRRISELEQNGYQLPPHWTTGHRPAKSGFRGVSWCPHHKGWRARIRNVQLGYFNEKQAASEAVENFIARVAN